jgi:hypothetical protein
VLALAITILSPVARAASSMSLACRVAGGKLGLISAPITLTPGASSRSRPNRFASIRLVDVMIPVALPPGRLMLSTSPVLTGSPPTANTMGIVEVARFAAIAEGSPPTAVIIETPWVTRSAAKLGKRP